MLREAPSGFITADLSIGVLFEQAIAACSKRHVCPPDEVLHRLETGDRRIHSTFRYGVAKGLSAHLESLGPVFHGVYVYGSAIGDDSGPASDIDLIVVVATRCEQLTWFLKRLDLCLATAYRGLVRGGKEPASLLDIRIINLQEQDERTGAGPVLGGLHTRPICLWRSDPAITGALRKEGPRRSL